MFDYFVEMVKEFLGYFFVRYPGASIRYVVSGKKGFIEYVEDDIEYNILTVLSSVTVFVMIMLLYRIMLLV